MTIYVSKVIHASQVYSDASSCVVVQQFTRFPLTESVEWSFGDARASG